MDARQTMNCPECGNTVLKTDQFCSKCYARLEPPGLWRKFLSLFRPAIQTKQSRPIIDIKKMVTIETVGEDGQPHQYRSLDEVPPAMRAEVEKLQAEMMKSQANPTTEAVEKPKRTSVIFSMKGSVVYKTRGATGQERIYRSLDEVPWEKQSQLGKLESEAMKEAERLSSEVLEQAEGTPGITKKSISIFKIKDASGQERIYHSLDEMPPEIQEEIKRLQTGMD